MARASVILLVLASVACLLARLLLYEQQHGELKCLTLDVQSIWLLCQLARLRTRHRLTVFTRGAYTTLRTLPLYIRNPHRAPLGASCGTQLPAHITHLCTARLWLTSHTPCTTLRSFQLAVLAKECPELELEFVNAPSISKPAPGIETYFPDGP